jgi:hypothetical protein
MASAPLWAELEPYCSKVIAWGRRERGQCSLATFLWNVNQEQKENKVDGLGF